MPAKKPATKSFDHLASRDLWQAVSSNDLPRLNRALERGGNPNDNKSLNHWSSPKTPLLEAAQMGYPKMIARLHKAGARRRSSGRMAQSALEVAGHHQQSQSVEALLAAYGKPTSKEMVAAFKAIDEGPRMDEERTDRWMQFLTQSFTNMQVRFSPSAAVEMCMLWLGGEGSQMTSFPDRIQSLLDAGLLSPNCLSIANKLTNFTEWGRQLSYRTWDEDSQSTLDLLHTLDFPFDTLAQKLPEDEQGIRWVQEQASIRQHRLMHHATQTPSVRRSSPRL
jgi:hypothetical protein